jgi:hypothetical protein
MTYAGSTADCLAFEASDLCFRMEKNLLKPGLVLFGDNAYLNSRYMAMPYPNVSCGSRDNYNFYHSQVRVLFHGLLWLFSFFLLAPYLLFSPLPCLLSICKRSYAFVWSVHLECLCSGGGFFKLPCPGI